MGWPLHIVLTRLVFVLIVVAAVIVGLKVLLMIGRALCGSCASADAENDEHLHVAGRPGAGSWMPGMCAARDCRHLNPSHARYCGRCGRPLPT
jgi:hypothetical protein